MVKTWFERERCSACEAENVAGAATRSNSNNCFPTNPLIASKYNFNFYFILFWDSALRSSIFLVATHLCKLRVMLRSRVLCPGFLLPDKGCIPCNKIWPVWNSGEVLLSEMGALWYARTTNTWYTWGRQQGHRTGLGGGKRLQGGRARFTLSLLKKLRTYYYSCTTLIPTSLSTKTRVQC